MNENNEIPILAFVDDIVLLECDKREAQHQVTMVQDYLKGLGMSISWNKSQTLQVVSKEDTWYVRDPDIIIENDRIPNIAREEAFRYLGAKIGPWKVLRCGIIVPEILSMIKKTKKLSLKPGQKVGASPEVYIPSQYL
jgi:hypothetical protein